MKLHPKYFSYIPVLLLALERVPGDVLELGAGVGTFFLHWVCQAQRRRLVTYESDPAFYKMVKECVADFHSIRLVDDWADAEIERRWSVALVDHAPPERRKVEARRLAQCARCVILHDTRWTQEKHYHYKEILPLFRYRQATTGKPQTMIVSNFVDVGAWEW